MARPKDRWLAFWVVIATSAVCFRPASCNLAVDHFNPQSVQHVRQHGPFHSAHLPEGSQWWAVDLSSTSPQQLAERHSMLTEQSYAPAADHQAHAAGTPATDPAAVKTAVESLEWLRLMAAMRAKQSTAGTQHSRGSSTAHVCMVIRTYRGHGPDEAGGSGSLQKLLADLLASEHSRWEVQLVVLDGEPFAELPALVQGLADPRIHIHSMQAGPAYTAKLADGSWSPTFNDDLFNATDMAIAACDPGTQWVTVSNGDNKYDVEFLGTLAAVDPTDADMVAFDYYSRYQRPTAEPCQRFAAGPGLPPCKQNLLRFCHTDLASVAYAWPRLTQEGHTFRARSEGQPAVAAQGWHDAMMTQHLLARGWQPHWVQGRCLLSHSPSPQLCMLERGVWWEHPDDGVGGVGGRCISFQEAGQRVADDVEDRLQVMPVLLSHDPLAFGAAERAAEADGQLLGACLRNTPGPDPHHDEVFPVMCIALQDWGPELLLTPARLQEALPEAFWAGLRNDEQADEQADDSEYDDDDADSSDQDDGRDAGRVSDEL